MAIDPRIDAKYTFASGGRITLEDAKKQISRLCNSWDISGKKEHDYVELADILGQEKAGRIDLLTMYNLRSAGAAVVFPKPDVFFFPKAERKSSGPTIPMDCGNTLPNST